MKKLISLQKVSARYSLRITHYFFFFIASAVFIAGCGSNNSTADLALKNGNIITVDEKLPSAEAVAVKDGKILFVGTNNDIEKYIDEKTEVLDLKGATVIPGFFESHAHFLGTGKALLNLDLSDATNWDEIIAKVAVAAEQALPSEWIIGRGWHQEKWTDPPMPNFMGYPYNDQLSKATPYNPVMLIHASGHALIANKKAMDAAGVTSDTKSPKGGNIVRDSSGVILGVFEENAEDLIQNAYRNYLEKLPETKRLRLMNKAVKAVTDNALQYGITSFYDAGENFKTIDFLKNLADSGKLKIRLNVMVLDNISAMNRNLAKYRMIGYADNHFTVRGIKQYMDGALGSRGAWMLHDYSDAPGWRGLNVTSLSDIGKVAKLAIKNGYQLCTHAIGDRANRETLNIYEQAFKKHPEVDGKSLRWRIEHAQHLSNKDKPRFAKLGVIAAMQGIHATSDAPFVVERLGEKRAREGAYVWRDLINLGTVIANGTDSPVEKLDPIACYYASVTRMTKSGKPFFPEQKMTRMEALKSYTINGAYAAFQDTLLGSITKGKLADFTVLSQNILTVPDWKLPKTQILYTIIGGKVLYKRKGMD